MQDMCHTVATASKREGGGPLHDLSVRGNPASDGDAAPTKKNSKPEGDGHRLAAKEKGYKTPTTVLNRSLVPCSKGRHSRKSIHKVED